MIRNRNLTFNDVKNLQKRQKSQTLAMAEGLPAKTVWGRPLDATAEKPIVTFSDIMSEELATQLQKTQLENEAREQLQVDQMFREAGVEVLEDGEPDTSRDYELALELSADPDCSVDEFLARQLQREFDREQELQSQFDSTRANGVARAVLGQDSYNYLHEDEEEEESSDDDEDFRELATNMLYNYHKPEFPSCGFFKNPSGAVITKHDKEITAAKNCERAMHLPVDVCTGDVVGSNQLSNRVFNNLKTQIKLQGKRQARLKDKDEKAVAEASVDGQTRLILFKWINASELDTVDEVIATGKESVVLHASREGSPGEFSHYAIKIYKMTLDAFKNRVEYVKDDFRFKNPRRVMKVWAEKEFLNLHRLHRAGIRCPQPLHLKKHVLLMSMIGTRVAAPRLKNVFWLDEESKSSAFTQVREIMTRMFVECKLVHGDLSEFNLLYHDNDVYVIDVAQAVDVSHPRSLVFLVRDIENVLAFFRRIDTVDLPTSTAMFNEITGVEMREGEDLFVQVEAFETENRNSNLRKFKRKPADSELLLYDQERQNSSRSSSPARDFN